MIKILRYFTLENKIRFFFTILKINFITRVVTSLIWTHDWLEERKEIIFP